MELISLHRIIVMHSGMGPFTDHGIYVPITIPCFEQNWSIVSTFCVKLKDIFKKHTQTSTSFALQILCFDYI